MCLYTFNHYPRCRHIATFTAEACVKYTNGLRRGIATHCETRTRHQCLSDEHPTLCLQCEEAWLAAHSEADHQRQTDRSSLPFEAMEPNGSDWFVPARASPLESEMDAFLRAASPSNSKAGSLTEEMIRYQARAFAKLFGELGSDNGDELFNALLDDVHGDTSSQEIVDVPSHAGSSNSHSFIDCRQQSLFVTDLCESDQPSEHSHSCSSQDVSNDEDMDSDATMEDQDPDLCPSFTGDIPLDARSTSPQHHGSGKRTSLQSPLPEDIEMSRFFDNDTMDCDEIQIAISVAEDRIAILQRQIADMEFMLEQRIAEQEREGKKSVLWSLAAGVACIVRTILSLFGVRKAETGGGDELTATHCDPDGDWRFMDADEIEQEMWQTQAKLDALETQVTHMQNAFSRKMLVLLVERLIAAHRILDRRRY